MFDLTTKKNDMKVRNKVVVMKEITIKAVVKNQFLIKYLMPNSDVRILSTALVNTMDELLKVISSALAPYSALLKFSTIGTFIFYLGSQLHM